MKYFVQIIFLIFGLSSFARANSVADSLNNLINNTRDEASKAKLYNSLSKAYLDVNDTNALISARLELNLAQKLGDQTAIANSYHSLGMGFQLNGDHHSSLEYFYKELTIRKNNSDKKGEAEARKSIGESYRFIMEYDKATENLQNALSIFKELSDYQGIGKALNRMAAVEYELDKDNTKKDKCIAIAEESNLNSIKVNDYDTQIANYIIIGGSYIQVKNYSEALRNLNIALDIFKKTNDKVQKSLVLKLIADAYINKADFDRAIKYGKEAYDEAVLYNVKTYQWLSSTVVSAAYKQTDRYDSAFKYLEISRNLKDQLFDKEKDKITLRLESKFQKEQYDHNIEAQKQQKRMIYLIYSLTTFFILIILALLYFRYKKSKKLNVILEHKGQIIESQKEELSKSNATKDRFFAILSHDLKTPISCFGNLAGILADYYPDLSDEQRIKHATSLKKSSDSIMKLLEDLLFWSRVQSRKIDFCPDNLNLIELINSEIDLQREYAESKNLEIAFSASNEILCFADETMVKVSVRNLLANAIKFSNKGGKVIISANENDDNIFFSVQDFGVGISEENKDKLFRIDVRHTNKGTNNEIGTGLGLNLCKELIEKNKGAVGFESVFGSGATFYFTLPKADIE